MPVWLQVLSLVIGLFGVGDIFRLIFFNSSKKKANAEAEAVIAENNSKAVETLEKTVEILKSELEIFSNMHKEDVKRIEDLHEEKNQLNNDIVLCGQALCANDLCPIRNPLRGLGPEYFSRNKANLFNNKAFEKVLKEKGFKIINEDEDEVEATH